MNPSLLCSLADHIYCFSILERQPRFSPRIGGGSYHLYCVWDFVHRTHFQLSHIPPDKLFANDKAALEAYSEAWGRCWMAWTMMTERSDKTEVMFSGKFYEFPEDALRLAKTLQECGGEPEQQECSSKTRNQKKKEKKRAKKGQSQQAVDGTSNIEVDKEEKESKEGVQEKYDVETVAEASAQPGENEDDWEDVDDQAEAGYGRRRIKYKNGGRVFPPVIQRI